MSGKQCDKCGAPFKGFGTTCSVCRKGGKSGAAGQARDCESCGNYFIGFGSVCSDCRTGKGPGRTGVRLPTPQEVDECLDKIDSSIQKVDASQHSTVRLRKAELNLLGQLEQVRDIMQRILKSGDRQLLRATFIDAGRIARLDAFLGSVHLSEMNAGDTRLKSCQEVLESLQELAQSLGIEEDVLMDAQVSAQNGLLMKRLDFLMDEEKVAETHVVVDKIASMPEPKAPPLAHRPSATGGTGTYGGSYYSYYHQSSPGDAIEDPPGGMTAGLSLDPAHVQLEVEDDFSDWDDEDIEEMTDDQADSLFKTNARILFDELDVNKDGNLTKDEVLNGAPGLLHLLKACRIHKRKLVINMFKDGDIDNNGTLDFEEFMNYIQVARQKSLDGQAKCIDDGKVKRIFDLMDKDGDGSLTCEELKLAYAGCLLMAGEVVDSKRISKWSRRNFKKYDTDNSGTLDLSEFKQLLCHSGALAPMLDFAGPDDPE